MLRIMESSDDPTVNYLVDKMHKFHTPPSMPSVNQTQAIQSKGNYCDSQQSRLLYNRVMLNLLYKHSRVSKLVST